MRVCSNGPEYPAEKGDRNCFYGKNDGKTGIISEK